MSICITYNKGLGTGVVFLGVFLIVARRPLSKTASSGVESR